MTIEVVARDSEIVDSTSQVSKLGSKIDGLVREYIRSGSKDELSEALRLSRQREQLLKPAIIRK